MDTLTLYRPTGLKEWELVVKSRCSKWPPRLEHQPYFYPVLNREYATKIARDWNTADETSDFVGIVTCFEVERRVLEEYKRRIVGTSTHEELWVPADELDAFNDRIVGTIEAVEVFYGDRYKGLDVLTTHET